MGKFAKIPRDLWCNRKFHKIDQPSKLMFFYIMTAGIISKKAFYFDVNECAESGLSREVIFSGLDGLFKAGLIEDCGFSMIRVIDPLDCRPCYRNMGVSRPWISDIVRRMVYARDKFMCVYCGATERLELDHVEPFLVGGSDDPANLVTACKPCNCSKGPKSLKEWFQ